MVRCHRKIESIETEDLVANVVRRGEQLIRKACVEQKLSACPPGSARSASACLAVTEGEVRTALDRLAAALS